VNTIDKHTTTKIWNLHFHDVHDLIVIFQFTIKDILGHQVCYDSKLIKKTISRSRTMKFKFEPELKGLEIFKNPEVIWELELQIWDLDDRVLHKHRKKKEDNEFDMESYDKQ